MLTASILQSELGENLMSVNVVYTAGAIAVGGGNTGMTDGRFEVKLARPCPSLITASTTWPR
jgi:hypothetical protein